MLRVIVIAAIFISLASCQKELNSPSNPGTVDSATNMLLVKSVTKYQTDSFSFTYNYNASKLLVEEDYLQSWKGVKDTAQTIITRDGQGIINALSYKSSVLRQQGYQTFDYRVLYDASQSHYLAKVAYYTTLKDSSYKDSVAYTYNSAQQIVTEEKFSTSGSATGDYAPITKWIYSYDGKGNLTEMQEYSTKNTTKQYQLVLTYAYTYDAHPAPLTLGAEAIIIGDAQFAPVNNPITTNYTDNVSASNSYNYTTAYTLNSSNQPVTATVNYGGNTIPLVTTYTYQAQ